MTLQTQNQAGQNARSAFAWDMERIRELEALPEQTLVQKIQAIRDERGEDLCILAHLYQRKAIWGLANFVGDSYGLSKSAAEVKGGKYIVFCGVRFMAESAAILCRPDQVVVHPDPEAGCPMADMASIEEVQRSWKSLSEAVGAGADGNQPIVPVTYMNSTADIKSFCGKEGGIICTSSNASKTFDWAFAKGERILFLPDEHLGRNTALKYGIAPEQIVVWDPEKPGGGEDPEDYRDAKVILWRGYCPVHQKFTVRDVEHVRRFNPKAKLLVHPEVPHEVAKLADAMGSTEFIRQYVKNETGPGDEIFIATEWNLVRNLAAQYPDRKIEKLHRSLCLTMYQITLGRLLYALENLDTFETVSVSSETKHYSRVALERMLALK
jgi:quinolinate synthase